MKAVMLSIQPKWCEKIASGKKTGEVRKTRPKIGTPFKCYIYATKPKKYYRVSKSLAATDENLYLAKGKVQMCDGFQFWAEGTEYERLNGKVIGEFVCDRIEEIGFSPEMHGKYICRDQSFIEQSCIPFDQMFDYLGDGYGYGWHISDLVIYDKPKELSEFQQCHKCPHTCVSQSKSLCEYHRLKRPPQSWCYVEVQE